MNIFVSNQFLGVLVCQLLCEVLNVKGLFVGYGLVCVIYDLDFVVQCGEWIGIVGLNGYGKLILFYVIVGFIGWQCGLIKLNGREVGCI